MNIRLEKGLNLISIPLLLENRNVAAVLAPIIDKVVLVATFDRGAKTYEPVLPEFSDLKEIDHKHGYWIKVSEETSLPLNGRKLTEAEKRIEISQSWNLVSYLCEEARPTSIFFWSRGDILIVEGFDRLRQEKTRYYAPSNTGNLTQLLPLRGYWMKASGSFTLDYGDLCQRSFIEVFVDSFHLPKVQGIDTILDVPEHDVEVFKVTYGDPMDCPSGCIYSEAIGLQHKNKIGWLKTGGWSSAYQYMYEFDSGDVYLLSADFLSRLESADIWLYRSYISWVAKEPYTPDDVLLDLAQSLPSYIHSFLAQSLLENPKVQTNVEILTIIANLPYFQGDPYGEVRAEARRLLDRLASEGNSISARESAAHGGGYSDTASSLSTMSSNEMTMARFYEPPMLTTEWVDFYGTCDLDVGDEIAFYANGILSGWCEITVSGKYLCHVYGDDPTNEEMVGAAKGDLLTATVFDVSERREYVSNLIGDASWTEFLDRKKVDVEKAAPVPEFKASLVLDGDQEAYTLSWPERGTTGTYDVLYADDLCGEWKVAVEGLRQSSWADDGTETGGLSRNRFYRIAAY
jgi:hypothetical protein